MYVTLLDSIKRKRFTTPCAAYVEHDSDGLILLELTGATSAVEAMWAHIVKGRTERSLTPTTLHFNVGSVSHNLRVIPQTSYKRATSQRDRMIIQHEGLSRYRYDYLLKGDMDTPSPWFYQALALKLPYPVLKHWTKPLWIHAINSNLVVPIKTAYGVSAWTLHADDYYLTGWQKLITNLIKKKVLTAEVPNG